MSLSGDMSCVRVDRSRPITVFCCSVRPMFSVNVRSELFFVMVVGCKHFYVVFVFAADIYTFIYFTLFLKGFFI